MSIQNLTYNELYVYIQNYLKRSDAISLDSIPKWINLAEKSLAIKLKTLGFVSVIRTQCTNNNNGSILLEKPSLWHKTKSISVLIGNKRVYLFPREYELLQVYLDDINNDNIVVDTPIYYCDYNMQYFLIGGYNSPSPITIELSYFAQVNPLSPENQTNYWTQYAPYPLLYSALAEAASFLRSDDRVAGFQQKADMAIDDLLNETRIDDNVIVRKEA